MAETETAHRSRSIAAVTRAMADELIALDDRLLEALASLAESNARWAARAQELGEHRRAS